MKNLKKRKYLSASIIFLVLISILSFKILDDNDDFEIAKSFDIFHNVVREIRLFYVDEADISKLINESTTELLEKLDPYTIFYPESKIEDFTLMTKGSYGGVGATILEKNGTLLITNVYKDAPADKAGLKIGDKIVEVKNIKVTEKNITEVKELLKGEPGSEIYIKIKRYGQIDNIEKTILREKIIFPNIPHSQILENKYAYVKLNSFTFGAGKEVQIKIAEMKKKANLEGVILDLRANPGGLLNEAVNIVSLFVQKGSIILSTRGKVEQWNHVYKAKNDPVFPNIPVIVLINSRSASASEIVAGALQDLDRAVIIGQRSFGKGLVQTTRKLSYNTRIKITTAKYYIPSGRCIQAIDYSHRNEDGSIGHVPDSLISEFKTNNGRKVFDGGGIVPDITVNIDTFSDFTQQLLLNNFIFDFGTKYFYENKTIPDVEKFTVSDKIYKDFTDFVINQKKDFRSKSQNLSDELLKTAKNEKYTEEIIGKIKSLKNDFTIDVYKELHKNKSQILPILEMSIVRRYYYKKGELISSIKFDKELKEAKNIFFNKDKYNLLLSEIND